jgi:MFS family permease
MNTATLSMDEPQAAQVPLAKDVKIIALVGFAHMSSHFSHLLLPLMFPIFTKEFGLSFSALGFLMSVFFAISGFGQAFSGFVVDRIGARPVLFGAILFLGLGCLWATQATSYADLILVAVLLGFGNCSFHPVDYTILNQRVSQPRLGHAFSVHGVTGNLGWAIAPVFMIGISTATNWHTAYGCASVMYFSILVLLWIFRDSVVTQVQTKANNTSSGSMLSIMKLPTVWLCFGFFLFSTMTLSVVQNFAMTILESLYTVSVKSATMTLTAYMLCAGVGMLSGGFVAAKFPAHSDRVVAMCMALGAALVALCGTSWLDNLGAMVVLAATGFALGIGGPSRDMMIRKATPKGATGRVYGVVYSGLDVGFAIAPAFFGFFMDHAWYSATLYGSAITLLISVFFALSVGKRVIAA